MSETATSTANLRDAARRALAFLSKPPKDADQHKEHLENLKLQLDRALNAPVDSSDFNAIAPLKGHADREGQSLIDATREAFEKANLAMPEGL